MFGYQEEKYEVLTSTTINLTGMKQIIEIRKPEEDTVERKAKLKEYEDIVKKRGGNFESSNKSPYISLIGIDDDGTVLLDCLFYYNFESSFKEKIHKTEDEKQVLLKEDLAKLIDPIIGVKIEDLNAYERIENHHTGYTKCGCVSMY